MLEDERLVPSLLSDAVRTLGDTILHKVTESEFAIGLFDKFSQGLSGDIKVIFKNIRHSSRSTRTNW